MSHFNRLTRITKKIEVLHQDLCWFNFKIILLGFSQYLDLHGQLYWLFDLLYARGKRAGVYQSLWGTDSNEFGKRTSQEVRHSHSLVCHHLFATFLILVVQHSLQTYQQKSILGVPEFWAPSPSICQQGKYTHVCEKYFCRYSSHYNSRNWFTIQFEASQWARQISYLSHNLFWAVHTSKFGHVYCNDDFLCQK